MTIERPLTRDKVRAFLLGYVWGEDTDEARAAVVDCILAQYETDDDLLGALDVQADRYSGAQFEPGPEKFDEGLEIALTGLYECHDGPHQTACPNFDVVSAEHDARDE